MSLTINAVSYDKGGSLNLNHQRYISANHTNSVTDYVDAKKSESAPSGDFTGVNRGEGKLTRTSTDGSGTVMGNNLISGNVSLVKGGDATEKSDLYDHFVAWLGTAEAKNMILHGQIFTA